MLEGDRACRSCTTAPQVAAAVTHAPPEFSVPSFQIEGVLGSGGMGVVYRAIDTPLGRRVAIKTVSAPTGSKTAEQRFLQEAQLMATIEDPNVVRVYSFGESAGRRYLVMEYVEGRSLADELREKGRFTIERALRTTLQIAYGLRAAAMRGIIHRDVKPANVLIDQRENIRVTDFGLSLAIDQQARATQAGEFVGTPLYVAPEQAAASHVSIQTDMYSVGIVLYELLAGQPPFIASTPLAVVARHLHDEVPRLRKHRRDVPPGLEKLIDRMTRKNPHDRPASWDVVIDEIRALLKSFAAPIGMRDYLRMPLSTGAILTGIPLALVFAFIVWVVVAGAMFLVDAVAAKYLNAAIANYVVFCFVILVAIEMLMAGVYYFWSTRRS